MMRVAGLLLLVAFSWLPDCKGEGAPAAFEKFIPPIPPPGGPLQLEEMCTAANDGKRFAVEGYLQLPGNTMLRDGKADLAFYARIDGNGRGAGRSFRVDVTSPGDIEDLWAAATDKRGISMKTASIDPDALRIKVKGGVATPRDKIKLTIDVTAIKHYQTGAITACRYQFAKAERV
jgi:hypothetical protein